VGFGYTTHDNSVSGTAVLDNVTLKMDNVLALNLINFNAKNFNDKYSLLTWATSGEVNNDHFEIERSSVNADFKTLGFVRGSGTTTVSHDYNFKDSQPIDGTNLYRLKQVDVNGNVTYSPVVSVNFNFRKIEIFPNPVQKQIYIRNNINFSNGDNLKIEISDFSGKVLYKQNASSSGSNIITLNIPSTISNGMYVIMVTNSKGDKQGDKIFINR
jgi:hypothetical protein